MSESVVDEFVDNYEDACERGLSLSGENRDYFVRARITQTKRLASALASTGSSGVRRTGRESQEPR